MRLAAKCHSFVGLDAATVALPADIDLEDRAARMDEFWRLLFCVSRKYPGQMKTRTAHLPIRPDLNICDREVLEKRVGLYDLLAFGRARCVGTCHNECRVSILRR